MMHSRSAPTRQRGVSMIELLVSLLIFTFGMLGLAGLQTRTLTFNQSSLFRSQATALTDDILDRMRADRLNALAGRWDTPLTTASSAVAGALIYQADLKDWKQQVEALLPASKDGPAVASVTTVTAGADAGTVTVVIQWDETRGQGERAGAPTYTKFETMTKL
jgi:type IV pilus assembly protein PilV